MASPASSAAAALASLPGFETLDESVLDTLAKLAIPRTFSGGQVIYLEGEPATTLFILEAGWVKATRMSREGREQALRFIQPNDIFGDVAVFAGSPYPATALALEEVRVWAIDGAALLDLTTRHPSLALALVRLLARRILDFTNLVEDLSLRTVEARLARTLLEHAEHRQGQLVVPRRQWTTFDEMAARLGTVRDVLSRALHTLEQEGLLKVERSQIVLLNPDGLARRGESA